MTNEEILAVVRRYQVAIHVITGARAGSDYVIRDERKAVSQELWRGPQTDPQAFLTQMRIEQMRYALNTADAAEIDADLTPD